MGKIIIGIDIGKEGAFHIITDEATFTGVMPLDVERELNIPMLNNLLFQGHIAGLSHALVRDSDVYVVFEKLTPLHLSSKSSNWSLARQYGAIEALCVTTGVNIIKVPPKEWQAVILSSIAPLRKKDGTSDTKGRALLKVKELFPELSLLDSNKPKSKVPHGGIVDAILLAEYGRRKLK